jgi:hypothetical protein
MKVRVHVWHKVTGEIVAIGRPMGRAMCVPLSGKDQAVMEAEIEEEHIGALHNTHMVDVQRKVIAKRPQRN